MQGNVSARWERGISMTLALVALAAAVQLLYLAIGYAVIDGYIDHIEPSIALAGWRLIGGEPLYQNFTDWPFFGNFYGPLVYLVQSAVFIFTEPSIPMSKLANTFAVIGSLTFMFLHLRRHYDGGLIAFAMLVIAANLLAFVPISLWNRPDPFLFFLVSAALYGAGRFKGTTGAVVIGVCIGLAVNFKVHAFIYFLPLIVDVCGWRNLRRMAFIVAVSFAAFFLPFALPQVSFTDYVALLSSTVGGKGIVPSLIQASLLFSIYYLAPGMMLLGLQLSRREVVFRDALYFAVLAACLIVSIYPASIPGSGPYHLMPLFPIAIDATLRLLARETRTSLLRAGCQVLVAAAFLAISVRPQLFLINLKSQLAERNTVAAEVASAGRAYGGESLQIGYGDKRTNYQLTFYKPVLAFAGHGVSIDARSLMEARNVGFDIIAPFIEELRRCETRFWLIPKGQQPFAMKSFYSRQDIFGDAPAVFAQHYEKKTALTYYDLWRCRD